MLGLAEFEMTVCVFGREEAAVFWGHVARDIIQNVARDRFVLSILSDLEGIEIGRRELGLIVKHFFKVRHVPVTIDRVTMKSAANVIVHSASRHFAQRKQSHLERMLAHVRGIGILPMVRAGLAFHRLEADATTSRIKSHQKIERHWPREFRGCAKAAFAWVDQNLTQLAPNCPNILWKGAREIGIYGLLILPCHHAPKSSKDPLPKFRSPL